MFVFFRCRLILAAWRALLAVPRLGKPVVRISWRVAHPGRPA